MICWSDVISAGRLALIIFDHIGRAAKVKPIRLNEHTLCKQVMGQPGGEGNRWVTETDRLPDKGQPVYK